MTRTSYIDPAPDSSLIGLSAEFCAELPGPGTGGLLLEWNTDGASDGVAELDGMFTGTVSGAGARTGPSTVGGAATGGDVGAATGVAACGEGGLPGDCAGGLTVGGRVAGGCDTGETAGDFTGAATGETLGGGDESETGDCEGETIGLPDGGVAGDLAGEGGGFVVAMVGDGAGALSACTLPATDKEKTRKQSKTSLNMLNCLNLKWVQLRFVFRVLCFVFGEQERNGK